METLEVEPHVLAGRRGVSFNLSRSTGTVECMVTIKALQEYFWLEPDADDVRILRAFCNGACPSDRAARVDNGRFRATLSA